MTEALPSAVHSINTLEVSGLKGKFLANDFDKNKIHETNTIDDVYPRVFYALLYKGLDLCH